MTFQLAIAGAIALLSTSDAQVATPSDCGSGIYQNDRCYELIETTPTTDFLDAQAYCEAIPFSRARLATVNDTTAWDAVQDVLNNASFSGAAYVGLHTPDAYAYGLQFPNAEFFSKLGPLDVPFLMLHSFFGQGRCFAVRNFGLHKMPSVLAHSLEYCDGLPGFVCEYGWAGPECPGNCETCTYADDESSWDCDSCDSSKILWDSPSQGRRCITNINCLDDDEDGTFEVSSGPYSGDACTCEDTNARRCVHNTDGWNLSTKCHDGTTISPPAGCSGGSCPCDGHGN